VRCRRTGRARKEVNGMDGYTEYGYTLDGIEYATIQEAEEAAREAKE